MPQTKSHGKSADRKRAEIRELEIQMAKRFLCGTCHIGFDTQEEFEGHNETEEHNYHITRKIGTLVPGLAFCAACSCLVQTLYGWQSHVMTDKHQRVKQSLKLCGIEGEFDEPLGCSSPGQIGLPISPSEIDMKRASSYGYGHGGRMGAGIPIIGLESIHALSRGQEIRHKNLMEKFMCRVCMETFTFELRGNHLGSVEHWLNYLRRNYPAWHKAVTEIPPEYVIQMKFRLMFYAHKIEEREKQSESAAAQALRERFSIQATQRKDHNIGKDRTERERRKAQYYRPKPGAIVFVKEGEEDVAKYVVGSTGQPHNKKKKVGSNRNYPGKSSWSSKVKAGNQNTNANKLSGQNLESIVTANSTTSTTDPIVTVEKPETSNTEASKAEMNKADHTDKRKSVNLMDPSNTKFGESTNDSNRASEGQPGGSQRGASRGAPKRNIRGAQRGRSRNNGPKPRGGSKNSGPPFGYLAEDYWEPGYQGEDYWEPGYQGEDYWEHEYQGEGYGQEEYYNHQYDDGSGFWSEEPYQPLGGADGYGYEEEAYDPYYNGGADYGQQDAQYYYQGEGYQEFPPVKRQRTREYHVGYHEHEAPPRLPPPPRHTAPLRGRGNVRPPLAYRGAVMRGRGPRRPF